ncbi:hypothetical protein WICMUC_002620 [Wickerhamomyces mucosus]|uniref:Exonuclease V, mitochondrial n=1 Tax=Wickerhamomyces mucosus TaxID=1378264 RepID=A0A9P8TEL7_9ASCO|nr:hypothetical protein WICMUC_002620 [Wickerhamomyces mucosus]
MIKSFIRRNNISSNRISFRLKLPEVLDSSFENNKPVKDQSAILHASKANITQEEIELIESSDFIKNLLRIKPKISIDEHHEDVANIMQYVRYKNNLLDIKTKSVGKIPSPYEMIQSLDYNNNPSQIPLWKFPRLSVTKLLTQQWCELKEFYKIYSKQGYTEITSAMKRGNDIHFNLELATHAPLDFQEIDESKVYGNLTYIDTEANKIMEGIVRLMNLFLNGEAREIYLNFFLNKEFGVLETEKPSKDDILTTGIVDYIALREKQNTAGLAPLKLSIPTDDINEFLSYLEKNTELLKTYYDLSVCDVKTRTTPYLPQSSVINASKQQVMIYYKMLKVLGKSTKQSLAFLEEYFERKNINIDQPLSPQMLVTWIGFYRFLRPDFIKIRDGIYYQQENKSELDLNKSVYNQLFDLKQSQDLFILKDHLEDTTPFLKTWQSPVTIRYLLKILSRLFSFISSFQSIYPGHLKVQYYSKLSKENEEHMFHEYKFEFNEEELNSAVEDSLKFWLGKRDPKTIELNPINLEKKCKWCEFQNYCSWKSRIEKLA